MFKHYYYAVAALVVVLNVPCTQAQRAGFQLPARAVEIEPGAYYLGHAQDSKGQLVEGIAFLHPRGLAAMGGNGGNRKGSMCYALMARGARWKTIEDYVVNPENNSGLSRSFVYDNIAAGLGAWEEAAGQQIFGVLDDSQTGDGPDTTQPDDLNEFAFGTIDEPGVIAVTIVWGIFYGPPATRELVDWDMIFDDTDFDWGYAGPTSETGLGDTSIMDFLNIFTHESGHAAGLDHPRNSCTEETMYAYAQNGETKKRTLETGDEAGIRALYP